MENKPKALILASYTYENPDIDKLTAPPQDAADLERVLQDPSIGGFEVQKLIDEPHDKVEMAINIFFNERMRDDLLLLYFSGHGYKDEDNQLYLATPDTDPKFLWSTAVSSEFIHNRLKACRSTKVVVILDCCYSGAFPNGMAKGDKKIHARQFFGGRGRVALMASDQMQNALEGDVVIGEGKRSVFTSTLIKGLESGEADWDGDGLVSVEDLYDYAGDKIRPQMNPCLWYDTDYNYEDIVIAKSRRERSETTKRSSPRHRLCINKKCGVMLRPEADFCYICGVKATSQRGSQRCPDCGTPRRPDANFCPHCQYDWCKSSSYSS